MGEIIEKIKERKRLEEQAEKEKGYHIKPDGTIDVSPKVFSCTGSFFVNFITIT